MKPRVAFSLFCLFAVNAEWKICSTNYFNSFHIFQHRNSIQISKYFAQFADDWCYFFHWYLSMKKFSHFFKHIQLLPTHSCIQHQIQTLTYSTSFLHLSFHSNPIKKILIIHLYLKLSYNGSQLEIPSNLLIFKHLPVFHTFTQKRSKDHKNYNFFILIQPFNIMPTFKIN